MRIAFIAAGAGGMYCGTCLKDNALAAALIELGEDVTLVPTYTPLRVDEASVSSGHVFLGGVDVFFEEKLAWYRRGPGLLRRALGSQWLLRKVTRRGIDTAPAGLGPMTVSMLRGTQGRQRQSILELVGWLEAHLRPDIVHLSSTLLSGLAPVLKASLRVPVVCGFSGEDLFLKELPAEDRELALAQLVENSAALDAFIAPSAFAADDMCAWIGLDRAKAAIVPPGISVDSFTEHPRRTTGSPPVIGYLARISPEKGLHILADAFVALRKRGHVDARLRIGGYLGPGHRPYAAGVRARLGGLGARGIVELLGTLDREQKLALLRSIDVLCVPTLYPEAKGLFALEALASGVPVILPGHGAFPELVEATGGGLLHEPRNALDLAGKLEELLADEERGPRLGRAGREAVREHYTARRMAEQTLRVYKSVLSR